MPDQYPLPDEPAAEVGPAGSDLVAVSVRDVRPAVPAGPGVEAGLVVLVEEPHPWRRLEIVVGQPEARAILAAWSGLVPARPSTWDLFVSALERLGARLERAVVTEVRERRHFFGVLELAAGEETVQLDCRPSDAIALALRFPGAALVARRDVLDQAGIEDSAAMGPDAN